MPGAATSNPQRNHVYVCSSKIKRLFLKTARGCAICEGRKGENIQRRLLCFDPGGAGSIKKQTHQLLFMSFSAVGECEKNIFLKEERAYHAL